VNSDFDMMRSE